MSSAPMEELMRASAIVSDDEDSVGAGRRGDGGAAHGPSGAAGKEGNATDGTTGAAGTAGGKAAGGMAERKDDFTAKVAQMMATWDMTVEEAEGAVAKLEEQA